VLKKYLFILFLLLFNFQLLSANEETTEKELIRVILQGVEATQKFLTKVPTYKLYKNDKTILHYAVQFEKYDVVEFLISKNVDLSRKGGIYYQTALQDAIFYQYFSIARLLINAGTPLDIKNLDGDTALHIAARNGYMDMVNILVNAGASKNIYNSKSKTPYDLVPTFTMSNTKEMKRKLKVTSSIIPPNKKKETDTHNMATFTLDEVEFNHPTFVLDEISIDDESNGNEQTYSKAIHLNQINEDSTTRNSSIGATIRSD